MQTTALVHEAYLKLVDKEHQDLQNRAHFFAITAQFMRRILIDHARRHRARKRGGNHFKPSPNDAVDEFDEKSADLIYVG